MSTIVFKRLFEVQILHDYFLTDEDGLSFFDLNDADKLDLLKQKLVHQLYNVKKHLYIQPTPDTQRLMSQYQLRFAPTAVGFIVGVEVVAEPQNANTTFYKTRLELKPELSFQFSIVSKNPLFRNFTNIPLRDVLPANYYFTNTDKTILGTKLPISEKVGDYEAGKTYEMGELADFDADPNLVDIKEAKEMLFNNAADWEPVTDHRWINESDKMLLPHDFVYTFDKNQSVNVVEFNLLDETDAVIKTINKTKATPFDTTSLSFKKVDDNDENSADILPGFYTLKIKAGANPEISRRVHLNDDLYNRYQLGIVDIQLKEQGTDFSILDNNGYLKTRIDAGVKIPHPIYELRFRNRRTYWRYKSETGFSVDDANDTSAHLDQVNGNLLESKELRALTQAYVPFKNGTTLILPAPWVTPLRFADGKIYSDIYINKANPLLKE